MRKAISAMGRDFAVSMPAANLSKIQEGTLKTKYKGYRFCKSPFDIVLYLKLLENLKPRTIIEIGTSEGGSAVWFRDQCHLFELDSKIYSFDISPPYPFNEPNIIVYQADANNLDATVPKSFFELLPHPWLIIEDSAHTYDATISVLKYFDDLVVSGDYVVVEDGIVADLPGKHYESYNDGPNLAVQKFLIESSAKYKIDQELCDFYGHNVTYSPNGWLRVLGSSNS